MLLFTSAAKLPPLPEGLGDVDLGRSGGGAAVADVSDVTLNTGTLSDVSSSSAAKTGPVPA
ncbi:MAG: hypothetical protein AB1586_18255 [Pseudomonadota bacterium]